MFEHFERLDNYQVISHWLLIDQRPFKHYVLNQCSKWGNLYKEHLLNYVLNRLNVSISVCVACVADAETLFDACHSFMTVSFFPVFLSTFLYHSRHRSRNWNNLSSRLIKYCR